MLESDEARFLKKNLDPPPGGQKVKFGPKIGFFYNIEDDQNFSIALKNNRLKNVDKLVFGHLNINSIRNKFDLLADAINRNIDVLLISETKIDSSFPDSQFQLSGFSCPYRRDRSGNGGGLMLILRDDLPSKRLQTPPCIDAEILLIELNLRNIKWLLLCIYNPRKSLLSEFLNQLSRCINRFSSTYENILILGDFNTERSENGTEEFLENHCLISLIFSPTCFKNPEKPSCIDIFLTNCPLKFQHSFAIESALFGLSQDDYYFNEKVFQKTKSSD